ncbi:unnamed protein product [Peniophora sp. CBMAI 1063]|nr:unnamed protein product [Peniophora sp. CBMAI 1063]
MSQTRFPFMSLPNEIKLLVLLIVRDVWPAGYHIDAINRVRLGWIRLGHVCKLWRFILLSTPAFWQCVTTFYNQKVMVEFLARCQNAPVIIDLEVLAHNANLRPRRLDVMEFASNPSLWSRARDITTSARNAGYRCYTSDITNLLSDIRFEHLRALSAFLPKQCGRLRSLHSLSLRELSIYSDSAHASGCVLTLATLASILERSRNLQVLRLWRAVGTDETELVSTRNLSQHPKLALKVIDISSFDERILPFLALYCGVSATTSVDIDLHNVTTLSKAIDAISTLVPAITNGDIAARLRFDNEHMYLDGGRTVLFDSDFYAIDLNVRESQRICLRMDVQTPCWTWDEFVRVFPCENIVSFKFNLRLDDEDELPFQEGLVTLCESFRGARTVTVKEESHFLLLKHFPVNCPLQTFTVYASSGISHLIELWHALDRFNRPASDVTSILKGRVFVGDVAGHTYKEAPLLAALRNRCTVDDRRELVEIDSDDDSPVHDEDSD